MEPKIHYRVNNIPTLILLWDIWIKSTTPQGIFWKSILTLSTDLRLGLQSCLFPEDKLPLKTHLAGVKHRIVFVE